MRIKPEPPEMPEELIDELLAGGQSSDEEITSPAVEGERLDAIDHRPHA